MKPLVIPPAAQRDPNSVQMLSAWVAERGLHCAINVGMWQQQGRAEPPSWGILMADTVRHIANALEETTGVPASDTVAEIWAAIDLELGNPTSSVKGSFSHGHG
jgi:hypothetical protein